METGPAARPSLTEPVYHVRPNPKGWIAESADAGILGTYARKEEAIEAAGRALAQTGQGHVVVHRNDGSYELAWPQRSLESHAA